MMWESSAQEVIKSELSGDEKLIWNGQPKQGIIFRSSDIFFIPFSIMWGSFAIFWETLVLSSWIKNPNPETIIFPLFGIPFVIVGLYLLFGRFIVDNKQRERTFYGLTNQRIIIISGLFRRTVDSLNLKSLPGLSLKEKTDKSGTIIFGQNNPLSWWFSGMAWPGMTKSTSSFEMIENVKEVYEKIIQAQQ